MKLALALLLCSCISASMQQHQASMYDFWSYMPSVSSWRMPNYYNPVNYFSDYFQGPHQQQQPHFSHPQQDFHDHFNRHPVEHQQVDGVIPESRTPSRDEQLAKIGSSEPRTLLKLLGFDYLANYVINSLTFSTTSTTYTTVTSTVTVGTILTCYTSTMFRSTTACRRKRRLLPGLLVGDDGFETPSKVKSVETSATLESLAREVRSADPDPLGSVEIASSMNTDLSNDAAANLQSSIMPDSSINRYIREQSRLLTETEYIVTSSVTTYSLYTTTVTKTVTNFASSTALTCLPACFVLC